ncbi:MAG: 50S ribosomal protein L29 [Gammaproteobacteria bacterium]|nr:50S ribosomal protein L29 [Gammaproteobacteria bacterium]MDD9798962.1 50S ribosomal protein L29 [Gammaproteobacteria bacterium]MDD9815946.1 50S ribosomal protein L29 [Gammaproteobacteria bacterium]MDD9850704.1 50S ribosomal protein L29 [Gammaproteobacteria bacterium]MDD9870788.1 50S ribosomal protein L29 [Gammaproteobacteria bacterium]
MSIAEYRNQDAAQLHAALVELRKEQFNLRVQRSTGQLANSARFGEVRRDIARIQTLLSQRRLAAAGE